MEPTQVADRILEVLQHSPSGYFSDFDGVLSEIAPTPDEATAYPGVADSLAAIARNVDAAGIITGRAADDVATRFDISSLTVVGNHGLEWVDRGERRDHPAGLAAIDAVTRVLSAAHERIHDDGMVWENKRLSGTIHFRNTADPLNTELRLIPIIEELAAENNLRATVGKMIVELRPKEHVSKGTALEELAGQYGLESVVFWGDDVTDVDGFKTLRELRALGKHTLSIGVVTADAHPDIEAYADVVVRSVREAAVVMTEVAAAIESKP